MYYRAGVNVSLNPELMWLTEDVLQSNYSLEESLVYNYYLDSGLLLQKVEDDVGSVEYLYTILNHISKKTRTIADGTVKTSYTTVYKYDFMGNLTDMFYLRQYRLK